jgi:hypothetical protein
LAPTLELFLQGGLGNQLIQQAYAFSLAERSGARLRLNPLLLSSAWALLRGVTHRSRAPWLLPGCSEVRSWPRQWLHLYRLHWAHRHRWALDDAVADGQALAILADASSPRWLPLVGYFQRAQAFGLAAQGFWCSLAQLLHKQHQLYPHPHGQLAVHVRLGDYLLPQNQSLFAPVTVIEQLEVALAWRERLGSCKPLHVITDSPSTFEDSCPSNFRPEVRLRASKNAQQDFLELLRHRHIVASNSTFSLCAAKLSATLWRQANSAILPPRWYRDHQRDARQQQEWRQLDFVRFSSRASAP